MKIVTGLKKRIQNKPLKVFDCVFIGSRSKVKKEKIENAIFFFWKFFAKVFFSKIFQNVWLKRKLKIKKEKRKEKKKEKKKNLLFDHKLKQLQ